MAAVLAGGPGAVLSHRPAGARWGLRAWRGRPAITVSRWRRSPSEIEVHSSSLPRDEVTVLDGIPITTVPRTLLDLATLLDPLLSSEPSMRPSSARWRTRSRCPRCSSVTEESAAPPPCGSP